MHLGSNPSPAARYATRSNGEFLNGPSGIFTKHMSISAVAQYFIYALGRSSIRNFVAVKGSLKFRYLNKNVSVFCHPIINERDFFKIKNSETQLPNQLIWVDTTSQFLKIPQRIVIEFESVAKGILEEREEVFSTVLKIADLLSLSLPFPSYFVLLPRFYHLYGGGQYASVLRDYENSKDQGMTLEGEFQHDPKNFLNSTCLDKIINKLERRDSLTSALRLSRRAKELYLDGDITEALTSMVCAIECIYTPKDAGLDPDNKVVSLFKRLNNERIRKTGAFKEFVEKYCLKKVPDFNMEQIYKIRSDYIHEGHLRNFDWAATKELYHQDLYRAMQSLHFGIQTYFFDEEVEGNLLTLKMVN